MTLSQFVTKWLGNKADFDGSYGGQCVDLFRFYVKEVLNLPQPKSVVGAADFWTNYSSDPALFNNFTKIANTPEFIPQPGDVMLWTRRAGGGFGHVAIVLSADVNSFTSLDQNWPTLSLVTKTKHDYINVYGVLRAKVSTSGGTTTPETTQELKYTEMDMTKMREERDHNWTLFKDLETEYDSFKETMDNRRDRIASNLVVASDWDEIVNGSARFRDLDAKNLELQDKLEREIQTNKNLVLEHQKSLEALKTEMAQMAVEYEKKLANVTARVDEKLSELETAKKQYELTSRIAKWFSSLFKGTK